MSGPEYPDAPPPEVPEEFAATYRDAYRRAMESDDPVAPVAVPRAAEPVAAAIPDLEEGATTGLRPAADWRTSRWFLPVLVAVSALMLVLAAYAVGMAVSGDDEPGPARPGPTRGPAAEGSPRDAPSPAASTPTSPGRWTDPVGAVSVDAVSADCTAAPSTDAAGRRVTYVPGNAIDRKVQTAWRCAGTAVGEKLTLRIVDGADITEVGLIPGYAKTDPESGADRYAENNRITKVRWTFGDDVSFVQRLDPDPSSRAVQLMRVPRTNTDTVTLEILSVAPGPRNTTAISEIAVVEAR